MDCQFHNNCGGYCETPEEQSHNLCIDCLESEKEQSEFNRKLNCLVSEAKEIVLLLDKAEAGNSIERAKKLTRKLAALID